MLHPNVYMTSTADPSPGDQDDQRAPGKSARQDEAALADLRLHWADWYEVACRNGTWTARVRGEADVLTANTAAELEALISQDCSDHRAGTRAGSPPARSERVSMGQGERALRQLREDGII